MNQSRTAKFNSYDKVVPRAKPNKQPNYTRRKLAATALALTVVGTGLEATTGAVSGAANAATHRMAQDKMFNPEGASPEVKARIAANERLAAMEKEDKNTVCIPSKKTMSFIFKIGQGENAAVLAVKGSGQGEGDPCWDETKDLVEQEIAELHVGDPRPDDHIELPVEMIHEQKK